MLCCRTCKRQKIKDMDPKELLINALKNISCSLKSTVKQAKKDAKDNPSEFAASKIGGMFKVTGVYKQNFEELQVKTKKEFEEKCSEFFSNIQVQEAFDDLLDSEREWDDFLSTVDMALERPTELLKESEASLFENSVVDARSGEIRPLCSYVEDHDFLLLVMLRHFA